MSAVVPRSSPKGRRSRVVVGPGRQPYARPCGGDAGKRALLPAFAFALAACAGPRPATPADAAVVPPPAWRTALGPGQPIRADWWQGFGDPVLGDLVAQALAGNDDLAIAAARVEQARASARLARAQTTPQLSADLPASRARTIDAFGNPYTAFNLSPEVTVSYDLDLFGRLRAGSRAARAQALASLGARDAVRLATASAVASGYITLRALDLRLEVAQATLAARGEALRIARRRAETGYTSNLELRQAEGEYHATEQLVPQARLAIARAEDSLALLIGRAPGPIPRGLPLDRLQPPPIPDGLPADLLRRRPDLYEAEQTLVAADRTLDASRAALLPDVSLTGSAGILLSTILPAPVGVFSAGGSVLAPILDGGRRRAQAKASEAARDQAAFAYRRAALGAFRDVDDALAGVKRSGEQATALGAQRDSLAGALRNASNRYRAGYSAYIDQLDAQRGLLSAQLALVQATADRLAAYVALYQALGGGWSAADVAASRR